MDKKLPNVYANEIDKKIDNVQELYYGSLNNEERTYSLNEILRKINEIFASSSHVYKSDAIIKTSNGEIIKTIVGKTGNYLITIEGEKINISDILDIKKRI